MSKGSFLTQFIKINPQLIYKVVFSSTVFSLSAWGKTYTVTSSADSGAGSLRDALTQINAAPTASDTISIALSSGNTINLLTSLPTLNVPGTVVVDGSSTPGLLINSPSGQLAFNVNSGILAPKQVEVAINGGTPASLLGTINGAANAHFVVSSPSTFPPFTGTGQTVINGDLTLDTAGASNLLYSGNISGTSALKIDNGGGQVLMGSNTHAGGTQINTAQLNVVNDSSLGAAGVALKMGQTPLDLPVFEASESFALKRPIDLVADINAVNTQEYTLTHASGGTSGSGALSKGGAGTLLVQSAYTHTGGTNVDSGTLALSGENGALPTTGTITLAAGTALDISQAAPVNAMGPVTGTGSFNLGDPIAKVIIPAGPTVTYAGNTSGNGGGLIKDGPGNWSLTGNNTHTGSTAIAAGVLQVASDTNLGASSAVLKLGMAATDTPTLQIDNNLNMQRTMQVNASAAKVNTQANTLTHSLGGTSGPGTLVKMGAGTLSVQSQYAHTGGTQLDAGALHVAAQGAFSGDLAMASSTTFDISAAAASQTIGALTAPDNTAVLALGANQLKVSVANAAVASYAGSSTGTNGQFFKTGGGTLDLTGSLMQHTGNTTIESGVLLAAADQNLGAPTAPLVFAPGDPPTLKAAASMTIARPMVILEAQTPVNSAVIDTQAFTLTHTGGTTGSGALAKQGSGTLLLTSAAQHTGGNAISAGTLKLSTPAASIVGPMTLAQGATFDMSEAGLTAQSIGPLQGAGNVLIGSNTLSIDPEATPVFSGNLTGTVGSRVNKTGAGALKVQGNIQPANVVVAQGTLIVDTSAAVSAPVTVNKGALLKGTGRVGAIANTGTVAPGQSIGNFIVTGDYVESGTLSIEIDPTSSSQLQVGGNFIINPGSTLQILPEAGSYTNGKLYTVATFSGTETGAYSKVTTPFPVRMSATALYNSPNGAGTIQVLLKVTPFSTLVPGGNAGAAAECIETIPMDPGTDGAYIINTLNLLADNNHALRKAFNQLQPSQYAALAQVQENNDILVRSALTHHLQALYPMHCNAEWLEEQPGSVWVSPIGKFAEQSPIQHNYGYHAQTGGVVAGSDFRFWKHTYLGGAIGYTFTHLDWHSHAGHSDINSGYASVYGTWIKKHVFIDAAVIVGYNNYASKRHLEYPGVNRRAKSDHNGYQVASSLGVGGLFNCSNLLIEPWVRADYIYLHESGYTEHGAQSVNLHVRRKNSDYVRTDLGLRLARCYTPQWGKVIPEVKASWVYDDQLDNGHLHAHFRESDCKMTVTGLHPHRNLFAPGIGITIDACQGAFTFATHYDAEIGSNFWENRLDFNFGFNW